MSACKHIELASGHVLQALSAEELAFFETHVASCEECQRELASLQPVVQSFAAWPVNVLRPSTSLQGRLAERIAADTGAPVEAPPPPSYAEPDWEEVAPGIFVKMLASDAERQLVSMLVRLLPGVSYPPHVHAGIEELHLLDGELWINDELLRPGDYNFAEAPTNDWRVWSETGCTCVLVTSTQDVLG